MGEMTSTVPKNASRSRQADDNTATVPVLLDRAPRIQKRQVRSILQNRSSGNLLGGDGSTQTGPDIIET